MTLALIGFGLFLAVIGWLLYLAFTEPFRRSVPDDVRMLDPYRPSPYARYQEGER